MLAISSASGRWPTMAATRAWPWQERSEKTAKRAQANREAAAQETQDRDAAMIADSWDSVCKLVDLKEKAGAEVDTSRLRSLLIQLKN